MKTTLKKITLDSERKKKDARHPQYKKTTNQGKSRGEL